MGLGFRLWSENSWTRLEFSSFRDLEGEKNPRHRAKILGRLERDRKRSEEVSRARRKREKDSCPKGRWSKKTN